MNKIFLLFVAFFALQLASAASDSCDLNVSMINQDPYPAIPGEYVRMVFQVDGVSNPDCQEVSVELVEDFPISFDPGVSSVVKIKGGTFTQDYKSFLLVPFKVRVNESAIDGDNPIELRYASRDSTTGSDVFQVKKFNLHIEDVRATFEVSVRDYDSATNTVTFEILDTGKSDIEALTIDIISQDNFELQGSSRNIVGSLDSNEDTTFTFEGEPKEGQIILTVVYTDQIDVRRTVQETVYFNPSNFPQTKEGRPLSFWILLLLIISIVVYFVWKRVRHKRKKAR